MGLPNFRATARLFLHWTSRNVGGPAWYGDYQNDVAYAGYFNDQAVYYWNLMDVVQPSDLDYVFGQYNSAIGNRDTYQNRANQLLRSCN